ncbi:MAG: hypothetical protein ACI9VR_002118 [Cognaticolwellia sp.]|jgi:hypothetical protein
MLLLLLACHKPTPNPEVLTSDVGPAVDQPAAEQAAQNPAPPALGTPPGELAAFPSEGRGPTLCPDGRGAFAFWTGEYPGPIIDVGTAVTVRGTLHPCAVDAIAACTVPAGLYHPWGAENKVEFATVQPILHYQVKTDQEYAGSPLAAGSDLKVISYLAEGYCLVQLGEGEIFDAECPSESESLVQIPETRPSNQLVQVTCTEGTKVWVEDTALLAAAGVMEGQLLGYGEVGPATREPAQK